MTWCDTNRNSSWQASSHLHLQASAHLQGWLSFHRSLWSRFLCWLEFEISSMRGFTVHVMPVIIRPLCFHATYLTFNAAFLCAKKLFSSRTAVNISRWVNFEFDLNLKVFWCHVTFHHGYLWLHQFQELTWSRLDNETNRSISLNYYKQFRCCGVGVLENVRSTAAPWQIFT